MARGGDVTQVKKKIGVEELRVGMYVAELDRPWLETPFMFQGFTIRSTEEIEQLRRYCQHVYVASENPDEIAATARRTRVPVSTPSPAIHAARQARAAAIEQDLLRLNNHPSARPHYDDLTTLEEEIEGVRETYREARHYVSRIMDDVRVGKSLDVEETRLMVNELVESVVRNPDALTCFTQLKKKHEYTAQHSLRVCVLALIFGRQLGFERDRLRELGIGALLHDVGKARIPLEILDKPTALESHEIEIMKRHVPLGVEILEDTPGIPATAIEVARGHHERYDGNGYIEGLRGDEIGMYGLIAGIVDCYDAITSDRVYHAGISPHAALKRMYEWRGSAFHPKLIEQFIQCLGIYPVGSVVQLNSGEVGVVAALNRLRRLKPRVVLVRRPDNTPYPNMPAVNLVNRTNRDGRPCEIERVLDTETSGVNPAYFLPIPALS
jgi:putative nucleotidyltransferase with HDIG domain